MLGLGCFCVLCFILGVSVKAGTFCSLIERLNLLFHYYVYVHFVWKGRPHNDLHCVSKKSM